MQCSVVIFKTKLSLVWNRAKIMEHALCISINNSTISSCI